MSHRVDGMRHLISVLAEPAWVLRVSLRKQVERAVVLELDLMPAYRLSLLVKIACRREDGP